MLYISSRKELANDQQNWTAARSFVYIINLFTLYYNRCCVYIYQSVFHAYILQVVFFGCLSFHLPTGYIYMYIENEERVFSIC